MLGSALLKRALVHALDDVATGRIKPTLRHDPIAGRDYAGPETQLGAVVQG